MNIVLKSLLLVAMLTSISYAQDDIGKRKVPRLHDETTLVRLKSNPERAVGKPITICGFVTVSDYYNFSYTDAAETHYSLVFLEAGETIGDPLVERASLYFSKSVGAIAVEEITKATEKKKQKLVRAEVTILPAAWAESKQSDVLEVLDIQFYNIKTETWDPWVLKTQREADEKAKLMAEKAIKAKAAKLKEEKAAKIAAIPKKSNEEQAANKLKLARLLVGKNDAAAKKKFKEIVDQFPDTPAAKEAQQLLERQ